MNQDTEPTPSRRENVWWHLAKQSSGYSGGRDDSEQEELPVGPIWVDLEMGRGSREC